MFSLQFIPEFVDLNKPLIKGNQQFFPIQRMIVRGMCVVLFITCLTHKHCFIIVPTIIIRYLLIYCIKESTTIIQHIPIVLTGVSIRLFTSFHCCNCVDSSYSGHGRSCFNPEIRTCAVKPADVRKNVSKYQLRRLTKTNNIYL